MKKILIATHGSFAKGALSAASIILGEKENITCFNAYTEDFRLKEEIEVYFNEQSKSDTIIILTDMFGGSVNQVLMPYTFHTNIHLITGFNLALLLEIMLLEETDISDERLRQIVQESSKQVLYVNDVLKQASNDDFEF